MHIKTDSRDTQATLFLEGRFDFNSHRDFRAASEGLLENATIKALDINFDKVEYLDSSALGMLLLLREKAEAQGRKVSLSALRGTVKQVLDIANFGKLFTLRE